MRVLLLTATASAAALSGCQACGDYTISGTEATDAQDRSYNGSWNEACGVLKGTSGTWNHYSDGNAWVHLSPTAHSTSRSFLAIDIMMTVFFPTERLVVGDTLTEADMFGEAYLNPGYTTAYDPAGLTAASLEIVKGWEGEDVCDAEDGEGPIYTLKWDLEFGTEDGPHYTATGRDRVQFSTWLSEECGSW